MDQNQKPTQPRRTTISDTAFIRDRMAGAAIARIHMDDRGGERQSADMVDLTVQLGEVCSAVTRVAHVLEYLDDLDTVRMRDINEIKNTVHDAFMRLGTQDEMLGHLVTVVDRQQKHIEHLEKTLARILKQLSAPDLGR